jgi:hypothetical protein
MIFPGLVGILIIALFVFTGKGSAGYKWQVFGLSTLFCILIQVITIYLGVLFANIYLSSDDAGYAFYAAFLLSIYLSPFISRKLIKQR